MYKILYLFVFLLSFTACKKKSETLPIIKSKLSEDAFFNTKIMDPYRNIENLKDPTVITYLREQEEYSNKIFNESSGYKKLLKELNSEKKKLESINKIRVTSNGKYFYIKRFPNDKISKLYYRKTIDSDDILLYDPSKSSNKNHNINYIQPNWDGSKIAFGLNNNDKEFCDLMVVDVNSKKIFPSIAKNAFPNSLGGIEWLPDNSRFIYTYIPVINNKEKNYLFNSRAVIHDIESNNQINIFSKKSHPEIGFNKEDFPLVYITSNKNKYLLAQNASVSKYRDTYYTEIRNIDNKKVDWKELFKSTDNIIQFSLENDELYYRTSKNAPNFSICKTSLSSPNFKSPKILVKEKPDAIITDFALTKQGLFYVTSKNGVQANLYWLKNGISKKVNLPVPSGYLNVFSKGINHNALWIQSEGWLNKLERYKFNFKNNLFEQESLVPIINSNSKGNNFIVKEIEINSHDGVKVPLSIIHKKNTKLNGENSLFITGYGSYGFSETPYSNKYLDYWVSNGGVYAMAHVRGGGEKGDNWHKGGLKTTKPNTWKDFIACTEYLISNKYSKPDKVIAMGYSAGGITVGKAITERPDLFSAAIINRGMLNTLRLHESPNGLNNSKEFGDIKDSLEFEALLKMDSYHSIKDNINYPALLVKTGLNDARVSPWESVKFATRMQRATSSTNKPILLSIDFEGGHGLESSSLKQNEEFAKFIFFALSQTGHPDYKLKND